MNIAKYRNFLLSEIKINKPSINDNDLIILYNDIDDYINENWDFENETHPRELNQLNSEFSDIMKDYDINFDVGFNNIEGYLNKPIQNKIKVYRNLLNLKQKYIQ